MKIHYGHGNFYIKKTFSVALAYSFRGSVYYHHSGELESLQADVVLELRMLYLEGNRKSADSYTEGSLNKRDLKACSHCDTSLNKATSPCSATPFGVYFVSNHHNFKTFLIVRLEL